MGWVTNRSGEQRDELEFWVTRIRVSPPRRASPIFGKPNSEEVSCETENHRLGSQTVIRCGANTVARATVAGVIAEDDWISRATAGFGVSKDELIGCRKAAR